jgi:hypothetical protein
MGDSRKRNSIPPSLRAGGPGLLRDPKWEIPAKEIQSLHRFELAVLDYCVIPYGRSPQKKFNPSIASRWRSWITA